MIQAITHIPVWGFASQLYGKRDLFKTAPSVHLISDHAETSILHEWKLARRVIEGVSAALTKADQVPDIISVEVEMLRSKGVNSAKGFDDGRLRFHLPLVTNPRAFIYYEMQAVSPAAGILNFVPTPYVAANFGPEPRFHLIVDVQAKEVPALL